MVETIDTLCNISFVNIIECVISIWLYICFCMCMYPDYVAAKSWLAPGCSRHPGCPWGHQIGNVHLTECVSY
jgi:hypothetical protein